MSVYSINNLSVGIPATQPTMKFVFLNKLYFPRYFVDLSCNNNFVNDDIPESIQQIETLIETEELSASRRNLMQQDKQTLIKVNRS